MDIDASSTGAVDRAIVPAVILAARTQFPIATRPREPASATATATPRCSGPCGQPLANLDTRPVKSHRSRGRAEVMADGVRGWTKI